MTAESKHPLIVVIHGGPHAQQGAAFNFKNQVCAGRGWATLMVNYRGSTGYGQAFADAVFRDQNGDEAQDVLYGVSAAMRRNLWIDRDRIGVEGVSYGGQLSAWLITQTRLFRAAIPTAAIINLVSYNYTTYYNQYEQMTFGIFPHQGTLMDRLWERSALRYVGRVATATLLVHGENDNDVPISEAEQFYIEGCRSRHRVRAISARRPRHPGTQTCGGLDRALNRLARFPFRRPDGRPEAVGAVAKKPTLRWWYAVSPMNPEQAKTIAHFLIGAIEQESTITRKVIAVVPADKCDYRPHPTNKSALELAAHVAASEVWFLNSVAAGNFPMENEPAFKSPAEVLAWYEREFPTALAKVKELSGEQLAAVVDFYGMKFPNVVYLNFCQIHSIHHRGQLSAYLRPMGAKVPSIYGGSADEPFQMTETASA
ncbi:MAG TPA: DinB family protein [Bryobacteraceae bacterium]|nr:DinB family protein [Bryobacteraceae bacterium]